MITPRVRVAAAAGHFGRDLAFNLHRIEAIVRDAAAAEVDLLVLPHGILSGYHDHLDVGDDRGASDVGRPTSGRPTSGPAGGGDGRSRAHPTCRRRTGSTVRRWGRWRPWWRGRPARSCASA